jgi:hypothetical protein
MKCIQCNDVYEKQFHEDFKDGVCLPCQCQNDCEESERIWESELLKYEKRTGIKYDFNEFYFACEAGDIDKKNLRGLKELRSCYSDAILNVKFYREESKINQLELFQDNDLPF